jgi:hypothetical protein
MSKNNNYCLNSLVYLLNKKIKKIGLATKEHYCCNENANIELHFISFTNNYYIILGDDEWEPLKFCEIYERNDNINVNILTDHGIRLLSGHEDFLEIQENAKIIYSYNRSECLKIHKNDNECSNILIDKIKEIIKK